jgi:hypothetical protein
MSSESIVSNLYETIKKAKRIIAQNSSKKGEESVRRDDFRARRAADARGRARPAVQRALCCSASIAWRRRPETSCALPIDSPAPLSPLSTSHSCLTTSAIEITRCCTEKQRTFQCYLTNFEKICCCIEFACRNGIKVIRNVNSVN